MKMKKNYYIGIDLGGTFIKGGIVNELGEIIACDKTPTESEFGGGKVASNIVKLAESLLERTGISKTEIVGLGIGSPGMIDSKKGDVVFSGTLNWTHFPIAEETSKRIGLPVKLANDASMARLVSRINAVAEAYASKQPFLPQVHCSPPTMSTA